MADSISNLAKHTDFFLMFIINYWLFIKTKKKRKKYINAKKSKNSKLGNSCDNKYITWSKKKKKANEIKMRTKLGEGKKILRRKWHEKALRRRRQKYKEKIKKVTDFYSKPSCHWANVWKSLD